MNAFRDSIHFWYTAIYTWYLYITHVNVTRVWIHCSCCMAPISNHFNIFMYIKPQYNVTLLITWANKMAPNKRVIMRSYCITVSSKMMKWIFESNIPHELSHVGVQKLSVGNHEFYNMNGLLKAFKSYQSETMNLIPIWCKRGHNSTRNLWKVTKIELDLYFIFI